MTRERVSVSLKNDLFKLKYTNNKFVRLQYEVHPTSRKDKKNKSFMISNKYDKGNNKFLKKYNLKFFLVLTLLFHSK